MDRRLFLPLARASAVLPGPSAAAVPAFGLAPVDGSDLNLSEWCGRPVLVVNAASRWGVATVPVASRATSTEAYLASAA